MKINDYIICGGENLNDPPRKTPTFPDDAEKAFRKWWVKLRRNSVEKECYLELPISEETRIFIRAFWLERPGKRSVCYYVGLLLPKELYVKAGEYSILHKGLCNVSLSAVQDALESSFKPIDIVADSSELVSEGGLSFEELCQIKRYGKDFDNNIEQMRSSISINNIDDWFSRLFIAVNPVFDNEAYHIVISKEKPRSKIMHDSESSADDIAKQSEKKTPDKVSLRLRLLNIIKEILEYLLKKLKALPSLIVEICHLIKQILSRLKNRKKNR